MNREKAFFILFIPNVLRSRGNNKKWVSSCSEQVEAFMRSEIPQLRTVTAMINKAIFTVHWITDQDIGVEKCQVLLYFPEKVILTL